MAYSDQSAAFISGNLKKVVETARWSSEAGYVRFHPHPNPLPKGEGIYALPPLGEGLGMRVCDI